MSMCRDVRWQTFTNLNELYIWRKLTNSTNWIMGMNERNNYEQDNYFLRENSVRWYEPDLTQQARSRVLFLYCSTRSHLSIRFRRKQMEYLLSNAQLLQSALISWPFSMLWRCMKSAVGKEWVYILSSKCWNTKRNLENSCIYHRKWCMHNSMPTGNGGNNPTTWRFFSQHIKLCVAMVILREFQLPRVQSSAGLSISFFNGDVQWVLQICI